MQYYKEYISIIYLYHCKTTFTFVVLYYLTLGTLYFQDSKIYNNLSETFILVSFMILSKNSYRHRMLDTRAKFILLYDHRLFHSSLHYLWKKIVNVIFLRRHGRHHGLVIISDERIHPWYDISTVPFPSPIHSTFIPCHLDTWHQGKFQSGADLFREKSLDLRGQKVRVVTFQHPPASIKMVAPPHRISSVVEGNGPIDFGGLEMQVYMESSQKDLKTEITNKISFIHLFSSKGQEYKDI
jgi:hypothetical protein